MNSRYREKGQLKSNGNITHHAIWRNCSESSEVTLGTFASPRSGDKTFFVDTVVERFHERRARGEVFFNPMYKERVISVPSSSLDMRYRHVNLTQPCNQIQRYRSHGNMSLVYWAAASGYGSTMWDTEPLLRNMINDAQVNSMVSEVATKILSQRGRSALNLWETIAELNKSFAILDQLFRAARGVILSARNQQRVAHASDAWLLWRYGIRPILQDIDGVMKGITKVTNERKRFTTRGFASKSVFENKVWPITDGIHQIGIREDRSETIDIRGTSLDEASVGLGFNIGFSAKNLLTLPWELVRYSFVVDWIINVGDLIGSYVPSPGFKQLGSCLVITRTKNLNATFVSHTSNNALYAIETPFNGSWSVTRIEKTRTAGLPSPGLVVKEDFRFDTFNRMMDSLALLMQSLR